MTDADGLARTMSEVAMRLQDEPDRAATLSAIVGSAVATIPGADQAGISLIRGQSITAESPTDSLVEELDRLQTRLGEGPGLSTIREQHTVRIDDLTEQHQRWPRFAQTAVEWGVRSILSFRLFVRSEELGALNLYGSKPEVFTEDAEIIGGLFAQHAAVALAEAAHVQHLNRAVATRDVIGQAKGILIHRDRLTGQQAFDLLVRASQSAQMKLVEVARWLVEQTEPPANTPPGE